MLYSLSYRNNKGQEIIAVFYAPDDKEAVAIVHLYAERKNIDAGSIKIKVRPRGFVVGDRFYRPEEQPRMEKRNA